MARIAPPNPIANSRTPEEDSEPNRVAPEARNKYEGGEKPRDAEHRSEHSQPKRHFHFFAFSPIAASRRMASGRPRRSFADRALKISGFLGQDIAGPSSRSHGSIGTDWDMAL